MMSLMAMVESLEWVTLEKVYMAATQLPIKILNAQIMAKKKASPKKTLLPHKEVTVKSRAYGEHTRAARGSKTPVVINEVLQENVRKTAVINSTAKRVHDLIKHCAQPFKEKMLWQVMLSRMRQGISDDMMDLLMTLKGLELNSRYPLKRFAHPMVESVTWGEKSCEMVMTKGYPHWKGNDTDYCYEVFLLTLGKEAEHDGLVSEVSGWMEAEDKEGKLRFVFAVPAEVVYYVVCLHFMTGKDGKASGMLASRGMRIAEVGKGNGEG